MFGLGRPRKSSQWCGQCFIASRGAGQRMCVCKLACVFSSLVMHKSVYSYSCALGWLCTGTFRRCKLVSKRLVDLCALSFLVCLTRGQDRKPAHTTCCPHGNLSVACGTFTVSGLLKTETVRWMRTSHQCMCVSKRLCLFTGFIFNINLILFDCVNVRHAKYIFNCALMKRNYEWHSCVFVIVFLHK